MKRRLLVLIFLLVVLQLTGYGQNWAFKSNLLYDATTTLNLGVEGSMGKKMTFDLSANYNPWHFNDFRIKHGLIQPEIRYWFCEKFMGHFIGLHGAYARYNVGGLFFNDNMKHHRYQGHLFGGGFTYGYQWVLSDHWNLEAALGIGYARLNDKKYPCADCGTVIKNESRNYFGPTKIALSIVYILK